MTIKNVTDLAEVKEGDFLKCVDDSSLLGYWWTYDKLYIVKTSNGKLVIVDGAGGTRPVYDLLNSNPVDFIHVPKEDTIFKALDQVQEGDYLICEDTDNTPWWTVNKKYKVHTNNNGVLCIKDDEGDNRTLTNIIYLSNFLTFSVKKVEEKPMTETRLTSLNQVSEGDKLKCISTEYSWWTIGKEYIVYLDEDRDLCIDDNEGDSTLVESFLDGTEEASFTIVNRVQEQTPEHVPETPIMIDVEKIIEHITKSDMRTEELVNYLEGYKEGILSK